MLVKTEIDAGICGFHTTARVTSEDSMFAMFEVSTDCEKIRGLGDALNAKGLVNVYEEINPVSDSVVMTTARDCLKGCCAGCAVPVGLFKAMQVAAGLALPRDIAIQITKD